MSEAELAGLAGALYWLIADALESDASWPALDELYLDSPLVVGADDVLLSAGSTARKGRG